MPITVTNWSSPVPSWPDDVLKCGQFSINKHEQHQQQMSRDSGPEEMKSWMFEDCFSFWRPIWGITDSLMDRIVLPDEEEKEEVKCHKFLLPNKCSQECICGWDILFRSTGIASILLRVIKLNVNYRKSCSSGLGPWEITRVERAARNKSPWLSGAIKSALECMVTFFFFLFFFFFIMSLLRPTDVVSLFCGDGLIEGVIVWLITFLLDLVT